MSLEIAHRCERECGWLFVSMWQPCDELATCPGGPVGENPDTWLWEDTKQTRNGFRHIPALFTDSMTDQTFKCEVTVDLTLEQILLV